MKYNQRTCGMWDETFLIGLLLAGSALTVSAATYRCEFPDFDFAAFIGKFVSF